jgi:hypothetical protein
MLGAQHHSQAAIAQPLAVRGVHQKERTTASSGTQADHHVFTLFSLDLGHVDPFFLSEPHGVDQPLTTLTLPAPRMEP